MREMCQTFGITALGETVESWTLENEFLTAEVLTYGATLRRLGFGGRSGPPLGRAGVLCGAGL